MKSIFDLWRGRYLFHFTDSRNLASIRASGGLFSLRELQARQISPVAPGVNHVSVLAAQNLGLDDFVSLCFFRTHPMEFVARQDGRFNETCFLAINPSVLLVDGVKLCAGISNRSDARLLNDHEAMAQFDLEAMTTRLEFKIPEQLERRKNVEKYEVLVPKQIPLSYIVGV